MAITTNAICNSFKKELLQGKHDFDTSSDTYKLAMYTSQASIGASTENYSTTNVIKSCEAPSRSNVPCPVVVLVSLTLSLMTSAIYSP